MANENSPANLWTRRSNSSKLSLSVNKNERENHDSSSTKRFGPPSSHGKANPFQPVGPLTTSSVASPTGSSGTSAFGLGTGAFGFGSAGKGPKTPSGTLDTSRVSEKKDFSDEGGKDTKKPNLRKSQSSLRTPAAEAPSTSIKQSSAISPLRHGWVMYYRPPTSKNTDYEKSIQPLTRRIDTVQGFWSVYTHLRRPNDLPTVSDYHFFKDGIRPVWEDEENKKGGKWTVRLKKNVANRYWEDLLLAMIGDQFLEASEEVCGAVVSMRSGEDVISLWTKTNDGRNVKIRETIKRVLSLPADTSLQWRSHDDSITQRQAVDQARQEKAHQDKRRTTLTADKERTENVA